MYNGLRDVLGEFGVVCECQLKFEFGDWGQLTCGLHCGKERSDTALLERAEMESLGLQSGGT